MSFSTSTGSSSVLRDELSSMAAVTTHLFPPSIPFLRSRFLSIHASKSFTFVHSDTQRKLFSLSATSPISTQPSSAPIFLPFLEEEEEEERGQEKEHEQKKEELEEKEGEEDYPNDPMVKFFKSRPSTQDPEREGKFSLQMNRRSSWHLAPGIESVEEEIELEEGIKSESNLEKSLQLENEQMGSDNSKSRVASGGIVSEIVQVAKNLPENMTLGEVLEPYQGKTGENECVEVLELMGEEEGLVICCLYFFEWMGLQEPSLITPRACSVLFPVLGRAGLGDKLMILFQNLPANMEFQDVRVYNAAISGLASSKRYGDAYKVYEMMETNNIHPNHVTVSIVITAMRRTGRNAKEAWEYFEKMNRKGVECSKEVLGALVKLFCDEGLISQALIIQSDMEKKGIASNTIVYNTLMDTFSKSNRIEEVEGLFAEMKSKGLKPTCATFNILMDAYSRRMQPDIVEKLLLDMQKMGLEPNVKSYTCLISAYGRVKQMSDMAADAFLRMKKNGIKPTSHSYTALIHAYSVSGWHEKAYLAFENMQREGLKPSIETFTALLDAFRRAGDTETLMKIWKIMINEKIEGTRVTFHTLLDGFAKQGHYVEARDVISEFGKMGFAPTVLTYNILMNAYARGGQHSKMPQLLKEMAGLELKPDSVTYSTMIYAYVRVRDFKRAFFYHKKMVKSGQVPDPGSYEKLRAILDVKMATKNRKDKSAIMGIISSKMGIVKAKKGKKDEFWKFKTRHSNVRTPRISNDESHP